MDGLNDHVAYVFSIFNFFKIQGVFFRRPMLCVVRHFQWFLVGDFHDFNM